MKLFRPSLVGCAALAAATSTFAAPPALTIYNQNFAVVRERLELDLRAGVNTTSFNGVTTQLEPDSVVLRDPTGKIPLRILEQSYRADTASPGLMLSFYEGRELEFFVRDQNAKEYPVRGKVIRSGYAPGGRGGTPVIEVDGKLRFSLPGEPLFPALADDAILKPTLSWQLHSPSAAKVDAELSYVTGGLNWRAAYNFVMPEKGDTMDVVGWVTIENRSGTAFTDASIKLLAGEVSRVQEPPMMKQEFAMARGAMAMDVAQVTEKAFDEFHLYTLPRSATLRDQETKQVEFIRGAGVKTATLYVYEGAAVAQYRGWDPTAVRHNPDYGTQSNKKVWVMREFENKKENGLGLPLPAGRTRFYRRDDADGRLEFTGENTIEHTPQGETVRIYTGDAFDLVGERKRIDFSTSSRQDMAEEAFEITLRNRKTEPVEIRVVERLYRGMNWRIIQNSDPFQREDAQTVEFRVRLQPDEEKKITYRVRYTWQ
jgi:hypothetical protein